MERVALLSFDWCFCEHIDKYLYITDTKGDDMVSKTHGLASAKEIVTGNLQSYTVWCSSPSAYSDPENATGVNIRITGDIADETQKNFEVIVQSVGLRAMPIILNDPQAVVDLADDGAASIKGEGFVWQFGVEQAGIFATEANDFGLLIEEMNGIVLPNGAVLSTTGNEQNIEFEKQDI